MTTFDSAAAGTTLVVSTALDVTDVPAAVRRAADHAGRRWFEPRLSHAAYGPSSISFRVARPLEWPTSVRLSWRTGFGDQTDVRVSVRHAAGLSAGASRLLERFVDGLAVELQQGSPSLRPLQWRTAS